MRKIEERTIIRKTTRKIIVVLAMLVCFSGFLTLVSASLYEDFGQLETRGCNITDSKGVSFSKSNLINKFGLIDGYSSCSFILDYSTIDYDTVKLIGSYSFHYGEIKHVTRGGQEYIILLGESESALEEVVNLVVDYENHNILLRGEYVLFYFDNYFRLYEQGTEFEMPLGSNCSDDPFANVYTGNRGSIGIRGDITYFSSSCMSDTALSFPYCENDELTTTVYGCNCVVDRCVATVSEVFNLLAEFEGGGITQNLVYTIIESWINNPNVAYVPTTPISPPTPPAPTGGGEGTGAVAPTTWEETTEVSEQQFSRGYTKSLAEKERIEVKVEGKSHYVGVVDITETTVIVEVGSEPQQATLSIGEVRKFEVTDDYYYDIYVQLNSIENRKASLTIKSIYEEIPISERERPEEKTKEKPLWLWLVLVLIVVAVIGYLLYKKKKIF